MRMQVHRKRTWGRVALIGALVLVGLGAGCRKNPEEVLRTAVDRSLAATSVRTDIAANVAVESGKPNERLQVQLTGSGASAERAGGFGDADVTLTVSFAVPPGSGKLVLDERVVADTVYLRLQDVQFTVTDASAFGGVVPPASVDAAIGAVKGALGGKWVKVDPKDLAQLTPGASANVGVMDPAKLRALHTQVEAAVRANPPFVLRGDLGSAKVDGTAAYHYRIGIRADALEAILRAVENALGSNAKETEEMVAFLKKADTQQAIASAEGEVWIAKRTNDLLRIAFPVDIRNPGGKPGAITGRIEVTYRDWGKPVTVEAPTDAKTLPEMFGAFLGTAGGGAVSPAVPAE